MAQPLVGLVITGHEIQRPAVNVAGPRNPQTRGSLGGDDAVALIVFPVGAHQQLGVIRQVKINAAFELQRADEITMPAANQNLRAAAHRRRFINGALDGGGVGRDAVADRTEIANVKNALLPPDILRPQR